MPQKCKLLEDEQAAHLQFDEDGFAWNGVCATTQEITAARQTAILSFGSCNFDEPRDDLRALGYFPNHQDTKTPS